MAQYTTWRVSEASATELGTQNARGKAPTRVQSRIIILLAGHPLRGWPARLRGHKGSGLWKVWTVPSPPLPPLPSPPLPCPALPSPSPPLPSPPLPSLPFLPSLPPSRVPSRLAAPCRRNGGQPILMSARVWRRPAITKWKRSQISHVRASATKNVFLKTSNYASCDWNGD